MTPPRDLAPDFGPEWILHEDIDLIVIDKPSGVAVSRQEALAGEDILSRLRAFLRERDGEQAKPPLWVVPSIDRDASGLLLVARSAQMRDYLSEQLAAGQLRIGFLMCTDGSRLPHSARLCDAATRRDRVRGGGRRLRGMAAGTRASRARGSAPARGGGIVVSEVLRQRLVAGRGLVRVLSNARNTAQLRAQLSEAGGPVAGDYEHGGSAASRLMLHANRVTLRKPGAQSALQLRAPPPPELSEYVARGTVDHAREAGLLRRSLARALHRRRGLFELAGSSRPTTAFRLFHGGAEGSRSLSLDNYCGYLVAHLYETMDETAESRLLDTLEELGLAAIYVKRHVKQKNELADVDLERFAPVAPLRGEAAPFELVVHEDGVPLAVRLGDGLRTGLFLDQRDNRRLVRSLSRGARVLNLFAYTGGFSVAALAGGAAESVCVDSSRAALERAQQNVERIEASERHHTICDDVFAVLAHKARRGERFDLVVLDPPSYSTSRERRFQARKDYEELARACIEVVAPGGALLSCTNHRGIAEAELERFVRGAAAGLGRPLRELRHVPAPIDFPPEPDSGPLTKTVLVRLD